MPLWGNTDHAGNSAMFALNQLNKTANSANRTALFGNTTMGAFVSGQVVSQEGVDAVEAANTSNVTSYTAHAGWNLKTTGTGPLVSITISNGGTGYANTDLINVAATGTGSVNATATLTTNSTGGITAVSITNTGFGFTLSAPTVAVTNATGGATAGSNAVLVAEAGGRAGRISYETLVAMGTIG